MDPSAGFSQPQMLTTGNILNALRWRVRPGTDAMSATGFFNQWKSMINPQHRFDLVYRLIRVNLVMGKLRTQYPSREEMAYFLELLLGFEDRTWKNSQEELQYIRIMDTFIDFCKVPDNNTWPELIYNGREMDLLKDILVCELDNTLPTIFQVANQNDQIFLLVGYQFIGEVRALFQELTLSWNRHLLETNSDRPLIHLPAIPTNQISRETVNHAFDPNKADLPGAVLRVYEGIVNPITGLGLAFLPEPIAQYVHLLWHKEVLFATYARRGQHQSQNVLTVRLPWRCCCLCGQHKEVGTVFGMRTVPGGSNEFAQIQGFRLEDLVQKMNFCRGAFKMLEVVSRLNRMPEETRMVCCGL